MRDSEQLLGGFWFLRALLLSSIVLCIISLLAYKLRLRRYFILISLICVLYLTKILNVSMPVIGNISLIILGIVFLYVGYIYKQIEKVELYTIRSFVLLSLCVAIGSYSNYSNMLSFEYSNIISYIFFAILGTLSMFCISFSTLKESKMASLLVYIGDNTMIILALHFLTFKLISLLKIYIYNLPIAQLACFPVIKENNELFWPLYSLVGVFLPISVLRLYHNLKWRITSRSLG